MSFGTAVHASLERFFKLQQQNQSLPPVAFLLTEFESALRQEILTESEFQDRLQAGRKMLQSYYEQRLLLPIDVFDVERSFGGRRKILLGDIQLSGKIDRIDWADRQRGLLRVFDYKTGAPKTRGGIDCKAKTYQKDFSARELALPDSIKGPYKRQLIFYKLLFDLDRNINPNLQISEAVFEFIQPQENGKHASHAYSITDEEVEDLKKLIKEVMAEIRSLSFFS